MMHWLVEIFVVGYFKGLSVIFRSLFRRFGLANLVGVAGLAYLSWYYALQSSLVYDYIYSLAPSFWTRERVQWALSGDAIYYVLTFFAIAIAPWAYVAAFLDNMEREKYKRMFEEMGLVNKRGVAPVLVNSYKIDKHRKAYTFGLSGMNLEQFQAKKTNFEMEFSLKVESITKVPKRKQIRIVFTSLELPTKADYEEAQMLKELPPESFLSWLLIRRGFNPKNSSPTAYAHCWYYRFGKI